MKTYLVGGAVRDFLLNVPSSDRDWVVVGSTPQEMLAKGFSQVGKSFPVFLDPVSDDEYALARTETKTGDNHTDFSVDASVSVTLTEDLSRRDLTINAIAKDGHTYIDPFNGIVDLTQKVLRHVGPAFAEDPLRVLRVARFYARYTDFTVAPETKQLCKEMVDNGQLNNLSQERIWLEIEKVLLSQGQPQLFFQFLQDIGAYESVDGLTAFWDSGKLEQNLSKPVMEETSQAFIEMKVGVLLSGLSLIPCMMKGLSDKALTYKALSEIDWYDVYNTKVVFKRLLRVGAFSQKWDTVIV